MKKCFLTWDDIYHRASTLLPAQGLCYGVPRGGAIVAGLTHRAVDDPERAAFIVDDIVDSGATREEWRRRHPDKPFFALVDKTNGDRDMPWVVFPWEANDPAEMIGGETNITRLLQVIGEDPKRQGLVDTPKRVMKAWREMTSGYGADINEVLKTQFDHEGYDQMIALDNIEFQSVCEHHLLPFIGHAHVAYIPNERGPVVGISKLARLVEVFAKRLQIQERLTMEIAHALDRKLTPVGVAVMLEAKHLCMVCRGVKKQESVMRTSCLLGAFRNPAPRQEFFALVGRGRDSF